MTTSTKTTENIDEVFDRIARVVRRADAFVLGFAKCNSPMQQKQLSRALLERLDGKHVVEITLDEPIISLLEKLQEVVDVNGPPTLVNVFGLEKSIYAQEDYSPSLGRLNNDRDLIRRACPTVLLIWLPDYALDKMVLSAPDFWAWRSGVYEFPTNGEHWQSNSASQLSQEWSDLISLPVAAKRQEITRIEELLRTAQSLSNKTNRDKQNIGRLLYQSGILHGSLGNIRGAQEQLQESRNLAEEIDGCAHGL